MSAKAPEENKPAGEGEAAKSGPPVMVIAAALLVVLFAGGFALAYFVLPGKIAAQLRAELETPADHADPAKDPAAVAEGGHGAPAEKPAEGGHGAPEAKPAEGGHGAEAAKPAEGGGHGGGGGEAKPATPATPPEFKIEGLIVNVNGSRAGRFVRASLSFEAEPDVLAELNKQRARIVDIIGSTLASKSEEQLRAPTARGFLRTEILNAVNPLLQKGRVEAVFFLEYLIQP